MSFSSEASPILSARFVACFTGCEPLSTLCQSSHHACFRTRIEETDPEKTFRVGVLPGPSGCGKSSLVKAGLLPKLADHVIPVYVEFTSDDTEARLVKGLRKRCPNLPVDLGVADSIESLQLGRGLPPGKKAVLLIDQFEQWLMAHREEVAQWLMTHREEELELVKALRYCDGERLQTILIVRDDFVETTKQIMGQIGIEYQKDVKSKRLLLFAKPHAKKVLAAFGQAYGILDDNITPKQQSFLTRAVDGLAQDELDGLIIPVRLAVFAERLIKELEWTPKIIKKVGGSQGVEGVVLSFVDKTFCSENGDPTYQIHKDAARSVLRTLLPHKSNDIKSTTRSIGSLLENTTYRSHPNKLTSLIRILDQELRIIKPIDLFEQPASPSDTNFGTNSNSYQLTTHYLTPLLRKWVSSRPAWPPNKMTTAVFFIVILILIVILIILISGVASRLLRGSVKLPFALMGMKVEPPFQSNSIPTQK